MDSTIVVALVTGGLSLLGVALAGIVGYSTAKYNFQKPAARSILEEQYINVFAPLHRLVFHSSLEADSLNSEIKSIIVKQYHLIPNPIIEVYFSYGLDNVEGRIIFREYIDKCHRAAAAKLGYSQIKLRIFNGLSREERSEIMAFESLIASNNRVCVNSLEYTSAIISELGIFCFSKIYENLHNLPRQ